MRYRIISVWLAAVLLLLSGCGTGEDFTIHVQNLTGVPISELQIAPETDKGEMSNLLQADFLADSTLTLSLGKLQEADICDGFALLVYNAEDGSYADFGRLMIQNGDTVSFYLDEWGLAVAVNMTAEEIETQKQREQEDALSALPDTKSE